MSACWRLQKVEQSRQLFRIAAHRGAHLVGIEQIGQWGHPAARFLHLLFLLRLASVLCFLLQIGHARETLGRHHWREPAFACSGPESPEMLFRSSALPFNTRGRPPFPTNSF